MALEIIGAGFGRTGTNSLKLALERLGFGPCHHMHAVAADEAQVPLWLAAADGQANWDRIFSGFRAQVDWPGARFWRELAATYARARVILTDRPSADWCRSFLGTVGAELASEPHTSDPLAQDRRRIQRMIIGDQVFGGRIDDPAHLRAVYEAHRHAVIRTIAPSRLLVFDVGQGWDPLCSFLGVRVPPEPFPRTNSAEEFRSGVWVNRARNEKGPPSGGP
jgi:hypothetical protein